MRTKQTIYVLSSTLCLLPLISPPLCLCFFSVIFLCQITGDHALTACSVAKECKLISPGVRIFQSHIRSEHLGWPRVEWRDTEEPELHLDPLTLALSQTQIKNMGGEVVYELAVTGPVFKVLQEEVAAAAPGMN